MALKKCKNCGKISPWRTDLCDCGSVEFGTHDPNATKKVGDLVKDKKSEKSTEETVEEPAEKSTEETVEENPGKDKKKKDKDK